MGTKTYTRCTNSSFHLIRARIVDADYTRTYTYFSHPRDASVPDPRCSRKVFCNQALTISAKMLKKNPIVPKLFPTPIPHNIPQSRDF